MREEGSGKVSEDFGDCVGVGFFCNLDDIWGNFKIFFFLGIVIWFVFFFSLFGSFCY